MTKKNETTITREEAAKCVEGLVKAATKEPEPLAYFNDVEKQLIEESFADFEFPTQCYYKGVCWNGFAMGCDLRHSFIKGYAVGTLGMTGGRTVKRFEKLEDAIAEFKRQIPELIKKDNIEMENAIYTEAMMKQYLNEDD